MLKAKNNNLKVWLYQNIWYIKINYIFIFIRKKRAIRALYS